jgi:hypothetical protein
MPKTFHSKSQPLDYPAGKSKAARPSRYPRTRDFVIDRVSRKFMYAWAGSKTE